MRPTLVKNDFLNEDTGLTAAHICELSVNLAVLKD